MTLVKQLRTWDEMPNDDDKAFHWLDLKTAEAADEIESLRQQLARCIDTCATRENEIIEAEQQLAAALAACKLKDEAISDFLKQYPHMTKGYVLDALAIQPDDSAMREWLGEPVAWMITYDGKCMGFVPTEEANTVAVYSPKGLK